jgi:hypothetical protein
MSRIIKVSFAALIGFVGGEVVIIIIGVFRLISLSPAHPFNGDIKLLGVPLVGIMYHNSDNLGVTIGPKYLGLPLLFAVAGAVIMLMRRRGQ